MSGGWSVFGGQTDAWGYTRYSLVVHAPAGIVRRIMAFRAAIGMADLTSEPHVSLCASLVRPSDLARLEQAVKAVARATNPFTIDFDPGLPVLGDTAGMILVSHSDPLVSLRTALLDAVSGLIEFGGDPAKPFRPHVTLYQGAAPREAEAARELGPAYDFGGGFSVTSVELVGRVGPPRGGSRHILSSFLVGQG